MSNKTGPNDPCACGSGKKFKKCCGSPAARTSAAQRAPYTRDDRAAALTKLDEYVKKHLHQERDVMTLAVWGPHGDHIDDFPPELWEMSAFVINTWFVFDPHSPDSPRIASRLLEQRNLGDGERAFIRTMLDSRMLPYEVVQSVPGSSLTLRNVLEGGEVTVTERMASRSLSRSDLIAARVIPCGISGGPEMDGGVLPITRLLEDAVLQQIEMLWTEFEREYPGRPREAYLELLTPILHHAWLSSIFDPPLPRLTNTDGEELLMTRVSFTVEDERALRNSLDRASRRGIERLGDDEWGWSGPGKGMDQVSLGSLRLAGNTLTLETNSAERGKRGRAIVERVAKGSVHHRGTVHEDIRGDLADRWTAAALGESAETEPSEDEDLEPALEELALEYYARHYRTWVDEPVPALDGMTPRAAARAPGMKARVSDLIRGLEGLYERALKQGQAAYDPSWMWEELGLAEHQHGASPPLLAHERLWERIPASREVVRELTDRIGARVPLAGRMDVIDEASLGSDLTLQRFLRRDEESGRLAPYVPVLVPFEFHRRKVFWVDEALAYMLAQTEPGFPADELRLPFPSFALAFSDRPTLSLGERLLCREKSSPLRGQILRVLTVYVNERLTGEGRSIDLVFALDALGADLPALVAREIPATADSSLAALLDLPGPEPQQGSSVRVSAPERALLRLVVNSILYATSAGVTPEVRPASSRVKVPAADTEGPISDSVFYLPGKIDIRRVRQLQELERAPGGRGLLTRFLVRGHWRRPPKNWTEQKMRWIEPHWKGPDMAAIIEKTYRLRE
ncbi:MAG: SEC-C domain-containing protein [Acidobacteria bacterium]|nr:SEC-C domain-containing protein [Acidobacteriota bacterium]